MSKRTIQRRRQTLAYRGPGVAVFPGFAGGRPPSAGEQIIRDVLKAERAAQHFKREADEARAIAADLRDGLRPFTPAEELEQAVCDAMKEHGVDLAVIVETEEAARHEAEAARLRAVAFIDETVAEVAARSMGGAARGAAARASAQLCEQRVFRVCDALFAEKKRRPTVDEVWTYLIENESNDEGMSRAAVTRFMSRWRPATHPQG